VIYCVIHTFGLAFGVGLIFAGLAGVVAALGMIVVIATYITGYLLDHNRERCERLSPIEVRLTSLNASELDSRATAIAN
jgi:hypothetical protein